jgi:hypothetical protein
MGFTVYNFFIFTIASTFILRILLYNFIIIHHSTYAVITFDEQKEAIRNNKTRDINSKNVHDDNDIDNYDLDLLSPCTDIYQKVCSLYDDPSKGKKKTGTFDDMIKVNDGIVQNLIKTMKPYYMCLENVKTNNIEESYSNLMIHYAEFIKDYSIETLFDVWLFGGLELFTITSNSKDIEKTLYMTDFSINFDAFDDFMFNYKSINNLNKTIFNILDDLYYLVDINYPVSLEEIPLQYTTKRGINSKYKNIHKILNSLNVSESDSISFNGQYEFFEKAFSKQDPGLLKILLLISAFPFNNKQKENYKKYSLYQPKSFKKIQAIKLRLSKQDFNIKDIFKPPSLKQQKYKKHSQLDFLDDFCIRSTRTIYFSTINYKYYVLSNSKEGSDQVYDLIQNVIDMTKLFFVNKTKEFGDEEELIIHIPQDISNFFLEKMEKVKIVSMSSIMEDYVKDSAYFEMTELRNYTSKWLNLYHFGKKYRNEVTTINNIKQTRSGMYLEDRNNLAKLQVNTWDTVEAETVNAWYNPLTNIITVPIGMRQYPMFRSDTYYDLAFLGAVIGHELGHATDAFGRQFDKFGNKLEKMFKRDDHVENQIKCLVDEYGETCSNNDYGNHTITENMADQFGLRIILALANKLYLPKKDLEETYNIKKKILHRELFTNFAKVWCMRTTYKNECNQVNSDVHALASDRVTKTLRQFKSFKTAFQCEDNDKMVNNKTCIIY